jgi:NAD(P)-dependent dehydrogenase (short-subunit alcohol dehydrogenase family)
VSSSNPDRVQQTIDRLLQDYPSAKSRLSGQACNLGDQATVEDNLKGLFEKVTSDGQKLDHVVYTAGDPLAMMKIEDISMEKMIKAGMVRFFAPLLVGKFAPKHMNPGPKSSITLTTGSVSEKPRPNWSMINSFATGLHGMTRGLALDLKPIRVNLISPGAVDTELWNMMTEQQKKDMFESMSSQLATGKVGTPSDLAESYLFVLKDTNVTGSVISTNGGALIV